MNKALWKRLQKFSLDDQNASLSFSQRLARENRWTVEFSERVITEYKRFLYLCVEAGHPVTPSDEVDQAWHLHLVYTRSYWDELCGKVLKKPVHHGPTQGGEQETEKFHDWYARTLKSYQKDFGEAPPTDIWPDEQKRFSGEFQRIDLTDKILISKQSALAATIIAATALIGFTLSAYVRNSGQVGAYLLFGIPFVLASGYLLSLGKGPRRGSPKRFKNTGGSTSNTWAAAGCSHHDAHDAGCGSSTGCGSSGCGGGCGGN